MDQSEHQRGHRPLAFDKMERLVQEMQQEERGVQVRSQKQFLTSIPAAFTGTEVISWLKARFEPEDNLEAVNLANQLCHYGYFFPVSDWKNLEVKDDGSLYRFQIPYYWPNPNKFPDNFDYAVYLAKRISRNKQKHSLEDYELESLNSLMKNLANKWNVVDMQAQEQMKLTKDKKKGEKVISDSQERAYWRVYRPPPGYSSSLELVPIRTGGSGGVKKRRSSQEIKREVEFLKSCVERTRAKVSVALESLMQFSETYHEYDPMVIAPNPSNPWISDDPIFWQLNSSRVEVPTEKRVKRWALSMEELVTDETGLEEFTNYLRKEYSHENIRFWLAAKDLRSSSQSQILRKVKKIYDEFLAPGAPCEVNIDGKTMEKTQAELKNPSRFTFDAAAEHVYTLLLKKDCYPRFIRSEHYKNLIASALQPTGKRKFDFFGFGAAQARVKLPTAAKTASCASQSQQSHPLSTSASSNISKRRGSDRSLTESSHELGVPYKVAHSHSQSNIMDVANRDTSELAERWNTDEVCPWDTADAPPDRSPRFQPCSSMGEDSALAATAEVAATSSRKNSTFLDSSSSSDVSASLMVEVTERLKKSCGLQETINRFSRRSSSAVNAAKAGSSGSNRPSVSSTEDLTGTPFRSFDSNPSAGASDRECGGPSDEPVPVAGCSSAGSHPRRRSITALIGGRKLSASNTTPVIINVSTVTEQGEQKVSQQPPPSPPMASPAMGTAAEGLFASTSAQNPASVSTSKRKKHMKTASAGAVTGLKKSESLEVKMEAPSFVRAASTSGEGQSHEEGTDGGASPNEICPWENEENCKVKTSNYTKFYETLGYL